MLVAGAPGLNTPPSGHFKVALSAVSAPFRKLITDLIDGNLARPDGSRLDISPRVEQPGHLQLVAIELLPGSDRCFLIDVWVRTDGGRDGQWDPRGTPVLSDDVLTDGRWEFYNCYVALRQWGRSAHLRGVYPKD